MKLLHWNARQLVVCSSVETSLLPFVDSDEQKGLHVSFEEDSSGVWKESLIGTAVEVPVLISYTTLAHPIIPTFVNASTSKTSQIALWWKTIWDIGRDRPDFQQSDFR